MPNPIHYLITQAHQNQYLQTNRWPTVLRISKDHIWELREEIGEATHFLNMKIVVDEEMEREFELE